MAISLLVLAGVLVPASAASAQPPPNDSEANATKITAMPFTETIDTSEATASGPSSCYRNRASVFYTFRSATRVKVQFDTFGSGYDTIVAVYTRDRHGAHVLRNGCSDDRLGLWGGVRFWAQAGVKYIFLVSTFRQGGELTVHLGEAPSGPLQFSLDIADGTVDPETGMATISGTMTCDRVSAALFEGVLRQLRDGMWVARGYVDLYYEVCSPGDPVVWTTEDVDTDTGVAFGPGPALVRQFYEWASDGWSSTYEEDVRTTIELVSAT